MSETLNFSDREDLPSSSILLSVCVAVFNVRDYLDECLESLHDQALSSAEFIIVDDGSTDDCLQIARRYEAQDARFRVIAHSENKGLLLARNVNSLEIYIDKAFL